MKANPTRRALLVLATAGLVVSAGRASAEICELVTISGTITNVANGPVPVGTISIRLEEQGVMDVAARKIAEVEVDSDGSRHSVPFTMKVRKSAVDTTIDPGFTIRLERDGRLTATNTTKQSYSGGSDVSLLIEPILY